MAETWRVVLASGEVLSVEAWTDADGVPWARHRTTYGEDLACHHTQREAVTRAVALAFPSITEILAPGEPTRAEAVAAERERCARLCDEVADECEGWDGYDGEPTVAKRCAAKIRAGGV